jgi:Mn2+/Fe2+ NRAMP family transporter
MWLAIAGVVLVAPDAAGLVFVAMAVVSSLAIAVLSLTEVAMSESFCGIHDRRWLKRIRLVSGAVAVVVAGVILV